MTEKEARQILLDHFKKWLRPGQKVWIGDVYSSDCTGYSFEAGIYSAEEGRPQTFPVWGVDAATKTVGLALLM